MNGTVETLLQHRTIRELTDEPVSAQVVTTLLDVVSAAATSTFYQQRTVIHVVNPAIREAVCSASGQPYVGGERGELFIFVVDLWRNAQIRAEAGIDNAELESTALFLQAVADVVIGAQSMVVAAESMGLGAVYLGSIAGDLELLIDVLKLPLRTYPLLGVLVGHPAQDPPMKPRLPREITAGTDTYPLVADLHSALTGYDGQVQEYTDLRYPERAVSAFTKQIATKPGTGRAEQAPIRQVLDRQRLALH